MKIGFTGGLFETLCPALSQVFPVHKPDFFPPKKVLKESSTVPTQNMFTFMRDN